MFERTPELETCLACPLPANAQGLRGLLGEFRFILRCFSGLLRAGLPIWVFHLCLRVFSSGCRAAAADAAAAAAAADAAAAAAAAAASGIKGLVVFISRKRSL